MAASHSDKFTVTLTAAEFEVASSALLIALASAKRAVKSAQSPAIQRAFELRVQDIDAVIKKFA